MLLSENIDLDSSLERNSSVHVVSIPSNLGDIFSMIVTGLTAVEIQEGTCLATLSCSWKLIPMHLLFLIILTLLV